MNKSLRNKVVIVTGASSGIGRSVALESAGRGASLILIARREEKLREIAAECRELSASEVHVFPTDLSKSEAIEKTFDQITKTVKQVDFLVNCAGFGKFEEFLTSKMQDATNMFMVNVLGLMYFTRLVGRLMMQERSGQIINMGSIAGKIPTAKSAAYSASKAAVIQFSNVLRLELKPFGVKVMTVNPGPVYTNFFNIADQTGNYTQNVARFMQDPDDVAWQIVHFMGIDRREINSPLSLAVLAKLYNLFPEIGDYLSLKYADRK
jgi:short-subunit dehydrogenase